MYAVEIMVLTSENTVVPIWICTALLEHTVLHSIVYKWMWWIWPIIVTESLGIAYTHTVMQMTHWWCCGGDAEIKCVLKDWKIGPSQAKSVELVLKEKCQLRITEEKS